MSDQQKKEPWSDNPEEFLRDMLMAASIAAYTCERANQEMSQFANVDRAQGFEIAAQWFPDFVSHVAHCPSCFSRYWSTLHPEEDQMISDGRVGTIHWKQLQTQFEEWRYSSSEDTAE